MTSTDSQQQDTTGRYRQLAIKLGLLAIVVGVAAVVFWQFRDTLNLSFLAKQESQLRQWQNTSPIAVAVGALLIYVAVTGLSLPGATVLTLAYGWYFGFWQGFLIVSFGSTAGATLAFLLSRYLFRDWVQSKLQQRFARIHTAFEREGAYYLFTLRLVPVIPFFVINAVMGLTSIKVATFWWVSQLGMLPGTAAYVYAGSTVPSLQSLAEDGVSGVLSWQMFAAFAVVGLLPLVVKKVLPQKSRQIELSPNDGPGEANRP